MCFVPPNKKMFFCLSLIFLNLICTESLFVRLSETLILLHSLSFEQSSSVKRSVPLVKRVSPCSQCKPQHSTFEIIVWSERNPESTSRSTHKLHPICWKNLFLSLCWVEFGVKVKLWNFVEKSGCYNWLLCCNATYRNLFGKVDRIFCIDMINYVWRLSLWSLVKARQSRWHSSANV